MRERSDDSRESEAMDVEERRAGMELSGNHDLMSNEQLDRYSRQIILKEIGIEGQRRLLNAKVLVVGAGGLGSPASIYLAAAGVGTIGIVDADRVDRSNLHRQVLHFDQDVGRPKTESARKHLEALNPDVKVIEYQERLDSSNALEIIAPYDVVINGCDNFPTRYLVNDACVLLKKPLVDASILRFEGQATVYLPGQGCYRCLFPSPPPPGSVPSCAEAGIIGALAGHMGTLQALEAIKVLLGIGKPLVGRMLLVDALTGEYRTVRWHRDPDCPACGDHPMLTSLIDYDEFCGVPKRDSQERERPVGPAQATVQALGWCVSVSELKKRANHDAWLGDVQWLDVREPQEYRAFRIPGATLLPMGRVLQQLDQLDPEKEIIVVCFSGERSAQVTLELRRRGFRNAYNLTGGMAAWIENRLPVEQG